MKEQINVSGYLTTIDENLKHTTKFIKTNDIRGIILRCKDKKAYYFNSKGIYSETVSSENDRIPQTRGDMTIGNIVNMRIIRKAISSLQLGDKISRLYELAKSVKLEKHELPKGVDRFITSIKIQVERDTGNNNAHTFDRIRVTCGIISSLEFFKEINDDDINRQISIESKQKLYIKKNKKEIWKRVLDNLENSKSFKKYGIPLGFLKLVNIIPKEDSSLEMLFELKQLGQDGQNNSGSSNKEFENR